MSGWRSPGNSRLYNALSVVELLVVMDCEGCQKRVRRAISKIDGVKKVEMDMEKQKVIVTGYVDEMEVLNMVRRSSRKAELWPIPYDDDDALHRPYSTFDDNAFYIFSDDNPHAYCSIM